MVEKMLSEALEMERKQIADAYKADNTAYWPHNLRHEAAEKYYIEKFNK
jgi:hypothetical protein